MAGASIAGMGALAVRYYTTDNAVERDMIIRPVMLRGIELAGEARGDLATRIIKALSGALPKTPSRSRSRRRAN